ncbi:alpha/beta hydrolase [Candidatus Cyanaurora vandensis]|uniref:alpha/beta hydrolase n=1 Tax=Candidatus Cyanaurora vandensis TaxID=2714958 RepID=UPI00257FE03E|nr:alpha/beta hydrolase [Candidatus Cyanaurora vandensis]
MLGFIVLGFALLGLFLSCWTVLAAPNMALLTLGVGAPEVSPWLVVGNLIVIGLTLGGLRLNPLFGYALALAVLGLGFSAWPLVQLPTTATRFTEQMAKGLGPDYIAQVPASVRAGWRRNSYNLVENFLGLSTPTAVRITENIPFAPSLRLNLYQPPRPGTYPTVVVIYGGAWQRGGPAQNPELSRYLAARGYVVVAIDYRHAPAHRFPAQIEDVRLALAHIRTQADRYEVDPGRIALLGRSAGAHLAMLAGFDAVVPVQAVVSYYGPIDLTEGYNDPPNPDPINSRATLEAFLGGKPDQLPELYRRASPANYVTRPLPPTLLVYGGRDHIVELRFAQRLYERLQATGTTAVLLDIPWAEHAFDEVFAGPSNQLALYHTERFLAWALR